MKKLDRRKRQQQLERRPRRGRKKFCFFCQEKKHDLTYRDFDVLSRFVTDRGKIMSRKATGVCAWHQRKLMRNIKQARTIGVVPYTVV